MATNYAQPGETVTLLAPTGGVLSGAGMIVGNTFGVATYDAIEAAPVEVCLTGVWTLPKAAGVINEGAKVWWNNTLKVVVNATGAGFFPIGVAVEAALDAGATVKVRLDGIAVVAAGA